MICRDIYSKFAIFLSLLWAYGAYLPLWFYFAPLLLCLRGVFTSFALLRPDSSLPAGRIYLFSSTSPRHLFACGAYLPLWLYFAPTLLCLRGVFASLALLHHDTSLPAERNRKLHLSNFKFEKSLTSNLSICRSPKVPLHF